MHTRSTLTLYAALALVLVALGLARYGACGALPDRSVHEALRQSHEPAGSPARSADTALLAAPSARSAVRDVDEVAAHTARVPVARAEHADLARLDILVRAEGAPVRGAFVELQGIGGVFPAPGTNVDDDDRVLTDRNGLASVFVRPMVTWYGEVATQHPRWVGQFVADSPPAGASQALEVELAPSSDARCVHLVAVSLPRRAPLGGATVQYMSRSGGLLRAPDGSLEVVAGADGRVVVCWPEDVTLRFEAVGHSVRKLTWDDAQRPVEQLAHTSMRAAETSIPVEVELAELGAVYGDSMPAWAVVGHVDLVTLQHPKPIAFERKQPSVRLDGQSSWRIDGVPTWVGSDSSRAFGADSDVPTFEIVWRRAPSGRGAHWQTAPLAEDITLQPSEARRIVAPWPDEVVELDSVVTIDGAVAPEGTQLTLVRRPAPSHTDETRVTPERSSGRNAQAERLARARQVQRFGEFQLALAVEADGHVRAPALQPGTYDVTTFLSAQVVTVDIGLESAAFMRPVAAAVLVLPGGSRLSRFTDEIALRRKN